MKVLTCAEVQEAAAEFALDILEPAERGAVAAHLLRCPACREEVDAIARVGVRLVELVPGTEPPLGFDRRVLARVGPSTTRPRWRAVGTIVGRRPRLYTAMATAAAAAALVFGALGWFAGRDTHNSPPRAFLTAEFRQGGRDVGKVEIDNYQGSSPWVSMTVDAVTGSQRVTCELVGKDGSVTVIGSFDLVGGSGSWGAPDRVGWTGLARAQLVGRDGHVIATATFAS
jgi:hypothetical protein